MADCCTAGLPLWLCISAASAGSVVPTFHGAPILTLLSW